MRCLHGIPTAGSRMPWMVAGNEWTHREVPPEDAKNGTTLSTAHCAAHQSSSHSLMWPSYPTRNVNSPRQLRWLGPIRTTGPGRAARPRLNALSLLGLRDRARHCAARHRSTTDGR